MLLGRDDGKVDGTEIGSSDEGMLLRADDGNNDGNTLGLALGTRTR